MDSKELLKIIRKGEGLTTEFKRAKKSLPENLFDSIVAFLNRNGGNILLGVTDDKKIEGVDPDCVEKLCKEISTLGNNPEKLDPPYLIDPRVVECQGKKLIHFVVPASSQVHKTGKKIFDRSVDGDFVVKTQSAISTMYLRKSSSYTENTVFPYLRGVDFKRGMLKKAKDYIRSIRPGHPWLKYNKEDFFKAAGLIRYDSAIGKTGYTLAALMLFGTDEAISYSLPYYKIEAIVRKQDLMRYDDRLTVNCNLIDSFELLNGFIEKHLPDKFYLEGKTRVSLRDKIFREVIANMLINREYMNPIPSALIIYKDKLITNNANKPFAYENLLTHLQSYPKNPHIATVFAQMGFAEYLGTGIRKISDMCKIYSGQPPKFRDDDVFIAEIPLTDNVPEVGGSGTINGIINGIINGTIKNAGNISESKEIVLAEIKKSSNITMDAIAANTGLSRRTVARTLTVLAKNKIIVRIGARKNGYWEIL